MLDSTTIFTIETNLPIYSLFKKDSRFPKYLTFSNEEDFTVLSLKPNMIDQEEIEEIAELVSIAMADNKIFGEIYDLMYFEEDCLLKIYFNN